MAKAQVVYEFEYSIADRHRSATVQFAPRPEHEQDQAIWRRLLLRTICEAIGQAESELVFDTPYGLFGNTSVKNHHHLERVSYLHLKVKAVPGLIYSVNEYSFFRHADASVQSS